MSDRPGFETVPLPAEPGVTAPDGAAVRVLVALPAAPNHTGAGLAHFSLAAGQVSRAVTHRSVEELWYFIAGEGEMWRAQGARSEIVAVRAGVSLSLPLGVRFQFRATGRHALEAVAVTLPPWPGDGEAEAVEGPWAPTVPG